ncbi:hypothetical protein J6590_030822 [Homalodisca vitripennis]|nr:hypothetical protein J6590_030822 [Homalodisca vitripennis]
MHTDGHGVKLLAHSTLYSTDIERMTRFKRGFYKQSNLAKQTVKHRLLGAITELLNCLWIIQHVLEWGMEVTMPSSNGHLVEMEQWSGMERAVAVRAYYKNGDRVTAARVFDAFMIFLPAVEFLLHMPYHHGFGILNRLGLFEPQKMLMQCESQWKGVRVVLYEKSHHHCDLSVGVYKEYCTACSFILTSFRLFKF